VAGFPAGGVLPGSGGHLAGIGPRVTRTAPPRVRPGRIWYLVSIAAILAGIAWVAFGFVPLSGRIDSFARVPLPAGGTVTLNHSGGYVVYYEGPGANSGRPPHFDVRIRPAAPPAAVGRPQTYGTSVNYTVGAHQGRAVLTLQVVHPGRFRVESSAVAGGSDLAFGPSIGGSIVGIVLPTIGLIFLGVAGWIILFIIRLTRSRRARAQGSYGS
jgi:hypothetical protein